MLFLWLCMALAAFFSTPNNTVDAVQVDCVRRLPQNPIIYPALLPGNEGQNINFPSLIRTLLGLDLMSWVNTTFIFHHIEENISV